MTAARSDRPAKPAGPSLVPGGSRQAPLARKPVPRASLASEQPDALLALLDYAGLRYRDADSPAAMLGIQAFRAGRSLALLGPWECISFDWDHTLSNYQIFEDLPALLRVRASRTPPPPELAAAPMVAIETARPFMMELAFGAAAGQALRQGISDLSGWEAYQPRVVVASHTWPDRLGVMGAHFMPILPLLEGLHPGSPDTYRRLTAPTVRSIVHLHHFLDYAEALLARFDERGAAALGASERDELLRYMEEGKAHHRKPLGAWAMRGQRHDRLLHVDDASSVVRDLRRQAAAAGHATTTALHLRHPHSRLFRDIQEWHKVSVPAFWRPCDAAKRGAAAMLARREADAFALPGLLAALDREMAARPGASTCGAPLSDAVPGRLPEGTLITVNETPTTVGEFWHYYVAPANRARDMLRDARRRHGGITRLRRMLAAPAG